MFKNSTYFLNLNQSIHLLADISVFFNNFISSLVHIHQKHKLIHYSKYILHVVNNVFNVYVPILNCFQHDNIHEDRDVFPAVNPFYAELGYALNPFVPPRSLTLRPASLSVCSFLHPACCLLRWRRLQSPLVKTNVLY